jgi:hypothetical protein
MSLYNTNILPHSHIPITAIHQAVWWHQCVLPLVGATSHCSVIYNVVSPQYSVLYCEIQHAASEFSTDDNHPVSASHIEITLKELENTGVIYIYAEKTLFFSKIR